MSLTGHLLGQALCWGHGHNAPKPQQSSKVGFVCTTSQVRKTGIHESQSPFSKLLGQQAVALAFRPDLSVQASGLCSHFGV